MSRSIPRGWFCPLYQSQIAEGKRLDIDYERLGYLADWCFEEITRFTGKPEPAISQTCGGCPSLPDGLGIE